MSLAEGAFVPSPNLPPPAESLLFSPLSLGPVTAPNRVWLPAMVTWLSNDEGVVTDDVTRRYVRYARGGAGTIVLEAMGIRDVNSGPLMRIGHDRYVPGLRELVSRMKCAGAGLVMPQVIDFLKIARRDPARALARLETKYPGCSGWTEEELSARLSPREWRDYAFGYRQQVEDLSLAEIESLPGLFAAAARRARESGFDGVELHFAHAYTMSSFLSRTNQRTDDYGGSLDNRARVCLRAIEAARAAVGQDFCLGLRLLGEDSIEGGSTVDDAAWFAVAFARAGVDFISVSRGGRFEDAKRPAVGEAAYPYTGHSGLMCMPTFKFPEAHNLYLPSTVRAAVRAAGFSTPVVGAGRINTYPVAESALQQGHCDLVGMARGLLADPDWPQKVRAGQAEKVHYCKYNNVCEALDRKHLPVTCQLWMKLPEGGRHPPEAW
ncbi:MAG: NADH:flavin oxidoreductase [Deltaproteobacteria bacterium]|nr:NADH:flavin oxidoreductase [Deltaproteobacteria bacterium]